MYEQAFLLRLSKSEGRCSFPFTVELWTSSDQEAAKWFRENGLTAICGSNLLKNFDSECLMFQIIHLLFCLF